MNMNFGQALEALKNGQRVSRSGWNGKGMWLSYVGAQWYMVLEGHSEGFPLLPYIGLKTADNCFVPWPASQTDILAEDWGII